MERKNNYISMGVTAFLTAAAILLFYDTLFGGKAVLALLKTVQPILYGAFIAYLLAPMVNFFERHLVPAPPGRTRKRTRAILIRTVGIVLAWVVIAFFFYLLASVLMPELYKSVLQLIENADTYYRTISGWVIHLLETNPSVANWVNQQMAAYFQDLDKWLTSGVLPQLQAVMVTVSGGVLSLVNFAKDLLVGVIASVYLLATKERCAAYGRKLVYSLFPREQVSLVLRGARRADIIFSGFVRGKLLDSIIIGVLCFAGCSILKFPYTPLVSVFVGVTNIIPFFGPFLGAPAGAVFRHLRPGPPAAGRQRHRAEDPGEYHGPLQPVGHHRHPGGGRLLRHRGHVLRRAGVRLPQQPGQLLRGGPPAEKGPLPGLRRLRRRRSAGAQAGETEKFVKTIAIFSTFV